MPLNSHQKRTSPGDERTRIVSPNFITDIIDRDLGAGRVDQVVTRFPPEPNGYLHLGHLKAIVLAFGIADDYGGRTNLRFDDTNPTTENEEYVEAIKRDIHWLGFEWDELLHASDYFDQLFDFAVGLIEDGKAYVDSLSESEIREYRGTVTVPGRESPYRERDVAENLDLFERMRGGEFPEGAHVLRARIDMTSRNMIMRDPLLYRIRHAHHYRTGDAWHIYPMYDFAHPLSDAIEGVSHSLCTLEFENNREFYDWLLANTVKPPRPHQYEFARLNLAYTVLSKRRLVELVTEGYVSGWDDPRMPTVAGLRRRGVTPEALRDFVNRVGVTRSGSRSDMALLEHSIRDDLNTRAPRVMAITDPLEVTITNYPEDLAYPADSTDDPRRDSVEDPIEELDAPYWPHDVPNEGSRPLPFGRQLYIEREDFSQSPPKGWRRLSPGAEVRLRHSYVIRCDEVVENEQGEVVGLRCSYDPQTLNRNPEGRRVQGAIHWLAAKTAVPAEFRLYDRLFTEPDPNAGEGRFTDRLNPQSLVLRRGFVEPSLARGAVGKRYQFERLGYFWPDPQDSRPEALVFNRIVTLKDSWSEKSRGDIRDRRSETNLDGAAESEERTEAGNGDRTRSTPGERTEVGPSSSGEDGSGHQVDPVAGLTAEQKTIFGQYRDVLGLEEHQAALLAGNGHVARFFETALRHHDNPRGIANWIVNELLRELKGGELEQLQLQPEGIAELVALIDDGSISARAAKEVFSEMLRSGSRPSDIVAALDLTQLSDESAIAPIVERLLAANPDKVRAYKEGKTGLASFFVGQVIRETGGRANPKLVREVLDRRLA